MSVKFLDLKKINNRFHADIISALDRTISSGWYINGDELKKFEINFAKYCGARYCVGVANGLDALVLTLRAWKNIGLISDGDEVIVPSNTFIATVLAISQNGLVPVFAEPEYGTFNIDVSHVTKLINNKTKVIMPVHLYGRLANMPAIIEMANENNILVLEDSAQAHGAQMNGCVAGNWGNASAFSFYPGKNLGALGDGGAITTNDEQLYLNLLALRNYGSKEKYHHIYKGFNSRLDEMQAAVLSLKLKKLDDDNKARARVANLYLSGIDNEKITLPASCIEGQSVWHLFVIMCNQRDALQTYLATKEIETLVHYPIAPHRQEAYAEYKHLSYPVAEDMQSHILSLPISPVMTDDEIHSVIDACNSF